MTKDRTCAECRFFKASPYSDDEDDDITIGECRVDSPVLIQVGGDYGQGQWPLIEDTAWCGRYEERTAENRLGRLGRRPIAEQN